MDDDTTGHSHAERIEEHRPSMVSLQALKAAVIDRRRFLIIMALLGLVVGAAFHLVVPRKYAAAANLYLVEPTGSDPAQAMTTDVSLLQTNAVARQAMGALHLRGPTDGFLASYTGSPSSNNVLSIKLTATSATAAVTRDNAVAKSFLAFRANEFRKQNQILLRGLEAQINSLNADIERLATSINSLSGSPAGSGANGQVATLTNQQRQDASQISQLDAQIQQSQLSIRSITGASGIIDPATLVRVSAKRVTAADGLSGLVAALGVGLLVVIVGTVLSDRLRRREDIAAALGAPIELSVGPYRRSWWLPQPSLWDRVERPGPGLQMVVRRLRSRLEASVGTALCIVDVEATEAATLAVAVLARSLAAEGRRVVTLDFAAGRPLACLFAGGGRVEDGHSLTVGKDGFLTVIVGPADPAQIVESASTKEADAVLVLATVDPAVGADHLATWTVDSCVLITAGKVTGERLRAVRHLLRRAGLTVSGSILIGSDSQDDSVGDNASERSVTTSYDHRPVEILRAGRS